MTNVICPRCGGQGGCPGSDFGDHGWHPCFLCCESGYITEDQMAIFEANEARLQEEDMHSGYQPEWNDDGADMADYEAEMSSTWRDSEPDHRLTGEDIPF